MSEFFKINQYIYICIYMLCFIGCQNTGKTKFMLTYDNKQFYFTLYKGNDLEKYLYEKTKEDGSINLSGKNYNGDYHELDVFVTNTINKDTFDLSEDYKYYEARDILIYFNQGNGKCYVFFLYEQSRYSSVQKVGELEKSSLDGFISFSKDLGNLEKIDVTFKLKPEQSILAKIIAVIVVAISLTLFYIIYLLIQF